MWLACISYQINAIKDQPCHNKICHYDTFSFFIIQTQWSYLIMYIYIKSVCSDPFGTVIILLVSDTILYKQELNRSTHLTKKQKHYFKIKASHFVHIIVLTIFILQHIFSSEFSILLLPLGFSCTFSRRSFFLVLIFSEQRIFQ